LYDGSDWVTPSTPLLKGTKRQMLIDNKRIIEKNITSTELKDYQKLALINAMLDLGEIVIDIENVFY
ncbi:MAG: chorismate-binding protein, partial [Ignavibacteria bacterium]|nr:chorismate-binding protein [Ignavibacteria bacterium]